MRHGKIVGNDARIIAKKIEKAKRDCLESLSPIFASSFCEFFDFVDEIFVEIWNCLRRSRVFQISKNESETKSKTNKGKEGLLVLLVIKVRKLYIKYNPSIILNIVNQNQYPLGVLSLR